MSSNLFLHSNSKCYTPVQSISDVCAKLLEKPIRKQQYVAETIYTSSYMRQKGENLAFALFSYKDHLYCLSFAN